MPTSLEIPVLLLKTRSQPDDGYEEYFSSSSSGSSSGAESGHIAFKPLFVPVLEHWPNAENLERLVESLGMGGLKREYGGMVFTSQRAVEGWRGVVERVEREEALCLSNIPRSTLPTVRGTLSAPTTDTSALEYSNPKLPLQDSDLPFPVYVVGPATQRSLARLLEASRSSSNIDTASSSSRTNDEPPHQRRRRFSPFSALNPSLHGSHTGSSALLAPFILRHYNALHAHRLFTFHAAPRLPFIPLVGPGPSPSKTAAASARTGGMVRLERDDERLKKKPLLFLVGETRRDVLGKVLMDDKLGEVGVRVVEVEVYSTNERVGFGEDFGGWVERLGDESVEGKGRVVVVVVFSPQGCESMLRGVGFLDGEGRVGEWARRRWEDDRSRPGEAEKMRFVITTIGPTTRDHLREKFGFEPDVCAKKPSPEGVGEGVRQFLVEKGLI